MKIVVVSELPLDVPGWQLVYDDEVKLYQNEDVFPRAFIAGEAQLADEAAVLDRFGIALEPEVRIVQGSGG